MTESTNYGIIGNVSATNLVVGSQGRIDVNGAAELEARIKELERAAAAYDGPPETEAQVAAAVSEVARELRQPEPDKGRLASRLATIGSVSGTATAVAGAASGLLSVIQRVL